MDQENASDSQAAIKGDFVIADRPPSFVAAQEELEVRFNKAASPPECRDGFSKLCYRLDKIMVANAHLATTARTTEAIGILQPTDLFLNYLSAVRASDWPRVRIIEHEIRSSG